MYLYCLYKAPSHKLKIYKPQNNNITGIPCFEGLSCSIHFDEG